MRYFFVDFENVGQNGLYFGDSKLSDSIVNIFYTERCMNINMDVIGNILDEDAKLQMHYVKNGVKNALDFQLSTYLGYVICETEGKAEYIIVSNDTGYDRVIDFWKRFSIVVGRYSDMSLTGTIFDAQTSEEEVAESDQSIVNNGVAKKKKTHKKIHIFSVEEIINLLSNTANYSHYKPYVKDITQIINRYPTKNKIHNEIIKLLGNQHGADVYNRLKPILVENRKR